MFPARGGGGGFGQGPVVKVLNAGGGGHKKLGLRRNWK